MKTPTVVLAFAGIVSLVSPGLLLAQDSQATQGQAAQGQAPAAGQKNWKDRTEYDLYTNAAKETNPQKKLDILNDWNTKYPSTDFKDLRLTLFITAYAALPGHVQDAVNASEQLIAIDPKNFTALYYITLLTPQLGTGSAAPGADVLDAGDKAANGLLAALDDQFAAAKKPQGVSDAEWTKARGQTEAIGHTTLGWIAMERKDWTKAEDEFTKSLQLTPENGQDSYWLGTVVLAEKNPDPHKQSLALYEFARAAAYDGTGALTPAGRQQVLQYLTDKAYVPYHGSKDGLDQLLSQSKGAALPPADFTVPSVTDIEKAKLEKENEEQKANPSLALWKNIQTALTAPDGADYFNKNMKGAQTPAFTGKLVSSEPELRPKTLVLAISDPDGKVADATLKLDAALPGKAPAGTQLTFNGIPDSYTASPFMVTFTVEKANVKGWPGKAEPARKPVRRRHS